MEKGAMLRSRHAAILERNKELLAAARAACEEILTDQSTDNYAPELKKSVSQYLLRLPKDVEGENILVTEIVGRRVLSRLKEVEAELADFNYFAQADTVRLLTQLHSQRMELFPLLQSFLIECDAAPFARNDEQEVEGALGRISNSLEELADLIDDSVLDTLGEYQQTNVDDSNW